MHCYQPILSLQRSDNASGEEENKDNSNDNTSKENKNKDSGNDEDVNIHVNIHVLHYNIRDLLKKNHIKDLYND